MVCTQRLQFRGCLLVFWGILWSSQGLVGLIPFLFQPDVDMLGTILIMILDINSISSLQSFSNHFKTMDKISN